MNRQQPRDDEAPRFVEVLTTAAAVCSFHGHEAIEATHMLQALDILEGRVTLDQLGRGLSPLVTRDTANAPATPAVQELVARWYEEFGQNVTVQLDTTARDRLRQELRALAPE